MKRQEKYKDTLCFHYHNQNPKNRITCDCVKRAISLATGIPYYDVVKGLTELQYKTAMDVAEVRVYSKYLEANGWVKHAQPHKKDGKKYRGAGFCKWLSRKGFDGNVVAHIGGHHIVAIIPVEGTYKICDTWDSSKGCIGSYWTKEG